ncbi:hypothetical protein C5167_023214 [Papaver somniferum]|uniref:HAT C-terminal dimerisation domain-containing protein n=1 Tax=Papaver somniferum TaxID=3469 RepID=A0A4Y7JP53_PAPSO|nr:hypothetical protein C5167_023214 [Papaver somniferum]
MSRKRKQKKHSSFLLLRFFFSAKAAGCRLDFSDLLLGFESFRLKITISVSPSLSDVMMDGKMREVDQDDDFDILAWWQANANRYKVLSYIARDILALHVSSVSSESACSTGKRVLTPWRAFMSTKTVEALLCTQSYLQNPIALDLLCDYVPDDDGEDAAG